MVALNEGTKPCVYKDSLGIPTIGIGNLTNFRKIFIEILRFQHVKI